MWYNPCYLQCDMGPDFTAYSSCTPPPPHEDPVTPTKAPCDPHKFPYKTLTYYNPHDCRNYTLYDIDAGCMPDWDEAAEVCEIHGMELAPHSEHESQDSLYRLCAANRYTCWMGGRPDEPGSCYLMSAEGYTLKQGCKQPVRFVCRTKGCYESCRHSNPLYEPHVPYCDKYGKKYDDFCFAKCNCEGEPVPCATPSPDPSPAKPPACDPYTHPYKTIRYYNHYDCRNYTLYDTYAECMPNWETAWQVCHKYGLEMAPYDDDASHDALTHLCAANRYTCWMDGDSGPGLCPLMSAEGYTLKQGCEQPVRFVCRTKDCYERCLHENPWCKPQVPYCDKYGNMYDDYCHALCDGMECYQECRAAHPSCKPHVPYCDKYGNKHEDYCFALCDGFGEPVLCAGLPPPPSPEPPSDGCLDKCDWKYPNWHVWVCDKDGNAYRNWCYAACNGCEWYTLCHPGGSGGGSPDADVEGDNVLKMTEHGYDYRMYTVDAKQRLPYDQAQQFCTALGAGWDLVPYDDFNAYEAVQKLCSYNKYTCWLKRKKYDALYPLMAADGSLQMQGPDQDVRFVCRKASSSSSS
ncbi:hypothetical protein GPECTOR_45g128 [Gonium pectorale]|uniref:Uncharacterized protein n=1 Tax=Gonium pectorale TaxID=33097 RepID=A0A150G8V6_GONPE|nr:hypothetical protein GPECTOR_45g128 [Gonium pectorale]|eukprot:KXZ46258.1 hypothetical protein GPECTOR_45g128 [Gonium pectorale]